MKLIKYRIFISLIGFLLFFPLVKAQTSWFSKQDSWTFYTNGGWSGEGVSKITVGSDTMIANQIYKKLNQETILKIGGGLKRTEHLRQSGSKIFGLTNYWKAVPDEFLMYDFSLSVGDTIMLPIYGDFNKGFGYIITSISSIDISGQLKKVQNVKWIIDDVSLPNAQKASFVEGIGNVVGLHVIGAADCMSDSYLFLDQPSAIAFDGEMYSFCNFTSDWGSFDGIFSTLCENISSSNEVKHSNFQIFPNPSNGEINISMNEPKASVEILIFDSLGRLIEKANLDSSGSLNTSFKGHAILVCKSSSGTEYKQIIFE
jgi:hypothetical protein